VKAVLTTTSLAEAHAALARLDAAGIEGILENEEGAFTAIGFPTPAIPLVLAVRDEDAAEAARVLAEAVPAPDDGEPPAALPSEEDAAFAERVRRSREAARRGWILAGVILFGVPALSVVYVLLLRVNLGTQTSFAVLLALTVAAVAAVEVARRVWRGPPT
jgi:hypothetical protein